jgi:hypothetical protein
MIDYTGGDDGYTPLMGASRSPYDISNTTRHEAQNFEGTPTQFYDDSSLRAILTRDGIMDVNSFNPIAQPGQSITADTPRQATNSEGQLLFVDSNGETTTRPTGTPMVGGTVGDAAYMKAPHHGGGVFGAIGSDFRDVAKDPQFHKFLLSAAAIGTGGLLAPELAGLGTVAEAFPVTGGALLPGTELGAVGAGALTPAALTPEAATALLEGLTAEQASNLMQYGLLPSEMQIPATGSLTATEALQYANRARQAMSALQSATGGGSGAVPAAAGATIIAANPNGPWNNNGQALAPGIISSAIHEQKPVIAGNEKLPMLFPSLDPALARQFAMSGNTGTNLGGNYFSYGSAPANSPLNTPLGQAPTYMKNGGVLQSFKEGGKPHIPEFITGTTGHYVKGRGDGQSDDIPAMLADGEYVFDAETVAQLGNGSSDAGAKVLDKMREALRRHKRSAPVDSIPPKSKSPLEYIKQGMKRT